MDLHDHPLIPGPEQFDAALEVVVARTGVTRYRYLATEHPDPAERDKWRQWILARADGEPPQSSPIIVDYAAAIGIPGPCGGCPGAASG